MLTDQIAQHTWKVTSQLDPMLKQQGGQVLRDNTAVVLWPLQRGFSTFLMLRPFNTVPHVVVTPNITIILLLL